MRKSKFFLAIFFFFMGLSVFAQNKSQAKNALIIANERYRNLENLSTPVKEAESLSQALKNLGFNVVFLKNASQKEMYDSLDAFSDKCQAQGGISFFHYGGHAIQINGQNFLIPVDSSFEDERKVLRESVELNAVMESMNGEANVVIIDACRDNPFKTSGVRGAGPSVRGLSLVKTNVTPKNSIICFSASEGQVAIDGIFTPILTNHISDKKDFSLVLRDVRREVFEKTYGKQEPVNSDMLVTDLFLAGDGQNSKNRSEKKEEISQQQIEEKKSKSDWFELGRNAYREKNFEEAFEYFVKAEKNRQIESFYYLGLFYEMGFGVQHDYGKALEYYLKAEKVNDSNAMRKLGYFYQNAYGTELNLAKAASYFEKAAKQENQYAQMEIAKCYEEGSGVPQSYAKAIKWYEKAAAHGNLEGIITCARWYSEGNFIKQNLKKAFNYYLTAADKGDADAQCTVGILYMEGTGCPVDYAKSIEYLELAARNGVWEAQNLSAKVAWIQTQEKIQNEKPEGQELLAVLKKAADSGWHEAQLEYAKMLVQQNGGKIDSSNSYSVKENLLKASKQGNVEATYHLGRFYLLHENNVYEGLTQLKKAAGNNYLDALYVLGKIYLNGIYVSKNENEALKYLSSAIELGSADASFLLAAYYSDKAFFYKEFKPTVQTYLIQAAERGHVLAQYYAGIAYQFGTYGESDPKLSEKWLNEAKKNGNEEAAQILENIKKNDSGINPFEGHYIYFYRILQDKAI